MDVEMFIINFMHMSTIIDDFFELEIQAKEQLN